MVRMSQLVRRSRTFLCAFRMRYIVLSEQKYKPSSSISAQT